MYKQERGCNACTCACGHAHAWERRAMHAQAPHVRTHSFTLQAPHRRIHPFPHTPLYTYKHMHQQMQSTQKAPVTSHKSSGNKPQKLRQQTAVRIDTSTPRHTQTQLRPIQTYNIDISPRAKVRTRTCKPAATPTRLIVTRLMPSRKLCACAGIATAVASAGQMRVGQGGDGGGGAEGALEGRVRMVSACFLTQPHPFPPPKPLSLRLSHSLSLSDCLPLSESLSQSLLTRKTQGKNNSLVTRL